MPAPPLRVMTSNVRNSGAPDGANAWPRRRDLWAGTVRAFAPDLLGVQEVLADQHDDLARLFPDYALHGVARDDGERDGEWALVMARRDRFDVLGSGTFWLGPDPAAVGVRAWDAAFHCRICSWATLHDRPAGRDLLFACTHLDNEGVVARSESAELLRRTLPTLAGGAPVVLVGDFNCTEADAPHALLTGGRLVDSYRAVHPNPRPDEASYHGFGGDPAGRRIDWVLHTPELAATAAAIDRTAGPDGRYPSDHFPVTATLNWT